MNWYQRLLFRLGIASTKLVGEDNETFSMQLRLEIQTVHAQQRALLSDLLRVAYKVDPQLGNQIKLAWSAYLQRTN